MATTHSQPGTVKRRRLAAAGTLVPARVAIAAAMTVGAPGPLATAHADPTTPLPPPGRPGGPPAGSGGPGGHLPNGPGPYVAIAYSPDNGSHGWGHNGPT